MYAASRGTPWSVMGLRDFAGLGQIDEGIDSPVQQRPEAPLKLLETFPAGIFAGQELARDDPVGISQRLGEARHPVLFCPDS